MASLLHSLFIVNGSGQLMLHKVFSPDAQMSGNDSLRMASFFHSLHAIASQVSPVPGSSGIEVLNTDSFRLHCFQAATGITFFCTADFAARDLDKFLRAVYELYADYVLKNPFHELDQVIKCELFDLHLERLVAERFKPQA